MAKRNQPTKQRESLEKWQVEEIIRQAEVAYITDVERRTIAYWWDQLASGRLTLAQFTDRATRGKWAIRRDRYWQSVTAEVLRKAKFQAVNIRLRELQEVQKVRQDLLDLCTPEVIRDKKIFKVPPKSLEGCMRAFVAVSEHQDAIRDRVLSIIEPELAQQSAEEAAGGQRPSTFKPEEMRKIARLLLEEKRQQQVIDVEGDESDDE